MKLLKFLILALLILGSPAPAVHAAAQEAPQAYSAKDFWQKLQNDPQNTEAEFVGKTLNLTGVVVETGMSVYLTPAVRLSDSIDGPEYGVCVLPRMDVDKLSRFNRGDSVSVLGRVHFGGKDKVIVLKECKLAE